MVNYKPIPIPKMGGHPAQCHVPFGSSWSLLSRSHHQLSNWRFLHRVMVSLRQRLFWPSRRFAWKGLTLPGGCKECEKFRMVQLNPVLTRETMHQSIFFNVGTRICLLVKHG